MADTDTTEGSGRFLIHSVGKQKDHLKMGFIVLCRCLRMMHCVDRFAFILPKVYEELMREDETEAVCFLRAKVFHIFFSLSFDVEIPFYEYRSH